MNLFIATGGYSGQGSDSSDYWAVSLITETDEETMKARMREAAERLGDKYDHCDFLMEQTDGYCFREYGQFDGLDPIQTGLQFEHRIDLDNIKREDLWSEQKMSEILEERRRAEEAKRQEERERQARNARTGAKNSLLRIKREFPDIYEEVTGAKTELSTTTG